MKTIGLTLDENKGIGPGFDFLRVFLALSVLFIHSINIAEGERHQFDVIPFKLIHDLIIPMFFALSGFLITGSALRLKLRDFILNRGMRIVPALAVDIFVSAIVIGPIFTVMPLHQYFQNREFFFYFANIIGWIHYTLPGIFAANPLPNTVNGSLWTVPLEIGCYILMSGLILFNVFKNKWAVLGLTVLVIGVVTLNFWWEFYPVDTTGVPGLNLLGAMLRPFFTRHEEMHFLPRGEMLYIYFLVGCLGYLFRYELPLSWILCLGCVAIVALGALDGLSFMPPQAQCLLYYPAVVYLTIFFGLMKLPRLPIYGRGDYSYGIYLYGFPIQQSIVATFPAITSPSLHFALSMLITSLVAMASWHWVEKPLLSLRRKFSFTARKGDAHTSMPHPKV